MVVNYIIQQLIETGFSEYEAKAYRALVESNPLTAYEIAKHSGIPTSKIYEVLEKLLEKKVVAFILEDQKKRYVPMAPEEFIDSRKQRLEAIFESLKTDLAKTKSSKNVSYIWNVYDYGYLLDKAHRMIASAQKTLLLSGWTEELSLLEAVLREQEQKGVRIAIVNFGPVSIRVGQVFQHPIEDTIYTEKGGRGLAILADAQEALLGTVLPDNQVEGAWSQNHGFVTLAEDYIKHDIYIMKIVRRYDGLLTEKFGEKYAKLRDVFQDEEVTP